MAKFRERALISYGRHAGLHEKTQVAVREHSIKLIAFVDACLIYTLSRRHWWAYISLVEVAWLDLPKTWLDLHGMTMRKLDTR
jgi:hypothetical protein